MKVALIIWRLLLICPITYKNLGFELVRFKTGTPPRINRQTVDFNQMEIQPGDEQPQHFSYETKEPITRSNPVLVNLYKS